MTAREILDAYAAADPADGDYGPDFHREHVAREAFDALRAVLDLHRPSESDEGDPMTVMYGIVCLECSDDHAIKNSLSTGIVLFPCPTVEAIEEALR